MKALEFGSSHPRGWRLISRFLAIGAAGVLAVAWTPAPAIATAGPAVNSGDWPQFRDGPTHEGYNAAENTLSPSNVHSLGVAWTAINAYFADSAPAVADGVAYVGFEDIFAAYPIGCRSDGGTCPSAWSAFTGNPRDAGSMYSSPAVADGVVYVGGGPGGSGYDSGGKLYAFSAGCGSNEGTCTALWTGATGGGVYSSPAVSDGVVYVSSTDDKLYAFAVGCNSGGGTCTPLWTGATGAGIYHSSPAVANGVVYIGSSDGKLYAFAVGCNSGGGTCTPLWTGATGGAISSSPAVANGIVYVGSNDHKLYAFAAVCSSGGGSCAPLWTGSTGGNVYSSPAVANGAVYVGSNDGKLYAFSVGCSSGGSCTPLWTGATGGTINSSPAVANGLVFVGSGDGKLYAFAVDCNSGVGTCEPLWTGDTGNAIFSSPVVATGVVYVGSEDPNGLYTLYAYSLEHAPLDHLVLSPSNATVLAGTGQAYTAEGFDAYDHSLGDATSATTFSIGGGGYCTMAVCTSTVLGDHTVVGADGAATGTAVLRIGATYRPISPVRLLDTRSGNGHTGKVAANTPITFQIAGRGGVPANAVAVTGNVTEVGSSAGWAIYLGPAPVANPTTSAINFGAGQITGNGLTVALSATGSLSATYISSAGAATDLVFDVTGFYTPDSSGATYHPMSPARLLDTRSTNGLTSKLWANTPRTLQVTGRGGVPANAVAVTGNVTVVNSSAAWALYLGPTAMASPTTSTVNFNQGEVKGNNLTVSLGTGGKLSATFMGPAGATTDLVFDVTGYYTADASGAYFVPLVPVRLLDSRWGNGLAGKLAANTPRTFIVAARGGVPSGATGVTGNVTIVSETNAWAVYLGPNPVANPTTSTLNFVLGDIKGNGLTVALSSTGTLSATYMSIAGNTTDLVFDVTGYFIK
jgi:outer membrane protein assembly factor BamB